MYIILIGGVDVMPIIRPSSDLRNNYNEKHIYKCYTKIVNNGT